MAVYKLQLEDNDLENLDCKLIAIHTSTDIYRLAYLINQSLNINLSFCNQPKKTIFKDSEQLFVQFQFEEEKTGVTWQLIENENEKQTNSLSNNDLFSETKNDFFLKTHFLPELKKVNYFFKIEGAEELYQTDQIITRLSSILQIITVYEIDITTLKSKNNLIY